MSYQKQNFANGEVLTAAQLNHIENGIVDLESNANTSFAGKSEVQANAEKISAESTRAKGAESALSTKIEGETTRAKAAEKANTDNLAAEVSRATGEEQRLDTAIIAEKTRAEQSEQALSERTDTLESCGFVVVDGKVCMKYVKS